MKKQKILSLLAVLILTFLLVFSGCSSDEKQTVSDTTSVSESTEKETKSTDTLKETTEESSSLSQGTEEKETEGKENSSNNQIYGNDSGNVKPSENQQTTEPAVTQPSTQPVTEKPTEPATEPQAKVCTINISCATVLNNMDKLKEEKKGIVPPGGIILSGYQVEIKDGDTAYDVLVRACQENRIHMDADFTPAYGSAYIKGIGNIYERDCGRLSGWTYCVNGKFPGMGCSSYDVHEGDTVEFLYTCDLGADVGNSYGG